jgi:hypothetical protein
MIFGICGLGQDDGDDGGGDDSSITQVFSGSNPQFPAATPIPTMPTVSAPTPVESPIAGTYTPEQTGGTDTTSTFNVLAPTASAPYGYTVDDATGAYVPITAADASPAQAQTAINTAQSNLAALTAAGASAAQIAVAQNALSQAQAAYRAAVSAAATASTCTKTLFPTSGICDSTLYMVGAAMGLLLVVGLMSGNPQPARR